ncbi:endonuclease/exonuclease/phosphatase family protein [Rhodopirellula sp. P2]|uniref:endonuclease/exonuclease/phosphatase family protein n=1 Tax=Rhodopirellula sp. P2 TaxID=2127060 RepID=UPI002367DA0B|nr:endonuclease/exonuclease/phosphatase family protein [Rhodopirellula sp. P2]WDQ14982.1 endonuclease/exonuclease/phosphatase family protein [Rhodopirellula sp. P2]
MLTTFNSVIYLLFAVLAFGSLAPLSSHPHWFIRGWDFPRVQIVLIATVAAVAFFAVNSFGAESPAISWKSIAVLAVAIAAWHLFRIVPYTGVAPTQATTWDPPQTTNDSAEQRRFRMLVTNVEMENSQFEQWSRVVRQTDADVVIAAEIDERWKPTLEELKSIFPHQIIYPQDNWYGMAMLSRLPILESQIRFRVQDDVPSIDALIELPSGEAIRVIGVHPRPPEPIRDNDAIARDAELVLWGKELAEDDRPIVIGGDLNDVAWSPSTRLFLRLSQLLDPRRGRGFYNSFHADHVWMRFPLDHVFHSTHFAIRELKRMDHVGSDHFPILIDLQLQPVLKDEQRPLEEKASDEEEAQEKLQRAAESSDINTASAPFSSRTPAIG